MPVWQLPILCHTEKNLLPKLRKGPDIPMNPDQIKTLAIEAGGLAAAIAYCDDWGSLGSGSEWEGHPYRSYFPTRFDELRPPQREAILQKFTDIARAAIESYEAAMWVKGEPPKDDGQYLLDLDGEAVVVAEWSASNENPDERKFAWRTCWDWFDIKQGYTITRYMPLPQPPSEVK